jgi:hypothetical protein
MLSFFKDIVRPPPTTWAMASDKGCFRIPLMEEGKRCGAADAEETRRDFWR